MREETKDKESLLRPKAGYDQNTNPTRFSHSLNEKREKVEFYIPI
jgi:hypothetical protein